MLFTESKLHPSILNTLNAMSFTECTAIQEKSIDLVIEGKDISGLAQTGTGKTAAFLLPIMHRFLRAKEEAKNEATDGSKTKDYFLNYTGKEFCLILVPTRELAEQVLTAFKDFSKDSDLSAIAAYGGVDIEPQKKALQEGVDFLIATPGRLIDLYKSHNVDLKQICAVVFDEADRMFDMGFKDEMVYLLQRIPKTRQFLVFSATLNFDVLTVAYQFEADPIDIQIDRDQPTAENVDHELFHIGQEDKPAYLLSVLKKEQPTQTIIFSNFRHQIEKLVTFLNANGYPAMGISSLLNQKQRTRVLSQFKAENTNNIMVATDVAARGLDIQGVDLVINYELPDDAENYVHRIGRTGRAGNKGKAFSLVCDKDVDSLSRIETYLKEKVGIGWLDDKEILSEFKAPPSSDRSGGNKKYSKSRDNNKRSDNKRSSSSKRPDYRNDKKNDGKQAAEGERRYPRTKYNNNMDTNKKASNQKDKPNYKNNGATKSPQRKKKRTYRKKVDSPKQSASLLKKITSALRFWN